MLTKGCSQFKSSFCLLSLSPHSVAFIVKIVFTMKSGYFCGGKIATVRIKISRVRHFYTLCRSQDALMRHLENSFQKVAYQRLRLPFHSFATQISFRGQQVSMSRLKVLASSAAQSSRFFELPRSFFSSSSSFFCGTICFRNFAFGANTP
jgi:hypothetical protein